MNSDRAARARLLAVYDELMRHDGYGSFRVELRILRRGQKEVIVDCGKQYRFVVDFRGTPTQAPTAQEESPGDAGSRALQTEPSQPLRLPGASARRAPGDAPDPTGD